MLCEKCGGDFEEFVYEKGETYKGIDGHHNPPTFLMKVNWEGEIHNLCREHHRELHDKIIVILNSIARTLKFIKSEHWVLQKMSPKQIEEARKVVYKFTREWLNKEVKENGGKNRNT